MARRPAGSRSVSEEAIESGLMGSPSSREGSEDQQPQAGPSRIQARSAYSEHALPSTPTGAIAAPAGFLTPLISASRPSLLRFEMSSKGKAANLVDSELRSLGVMIDKNKNALKKGFIQDVEELGSPFAGLSKYSEAIDEDMEAEASAVVVVASDTPSKPTASSFAPNAVFREAPKPVFGMPTERELSPPSERRQARDLPPSMKNGILLPANVEYDVDDSMGEGDDVAPLQANEEDMEHIEILDADAFQGVSRYFEATDANGDIVPSGIICRTCRKAGHLAKDCDTIVCNFCGSVNEHSSQECPMNMTCFNCGKRGHHKNTCPEPQRRLHYNSATGMPECEICGGPHVMDSCTTIWRKYDYYSYKEREKALAEKKNWINGEADGWAAQVLGDVFKNGGGVSCARCGERTHWADDCPNTYKKPSDSCFSDQVASQGPFARDYDDASADHQYQTFQQQSSGPTTYLQPQIAVNVGKQAREAAKAKANQRAARQQGEEDDEDDAFALLAQGGGKGKSRDSRPAGLPNKPKAMRVGRLQESAAHYGSPQGQGGRDGRWAKDKFGGGGGGGGGYSRSPGVGNHGHGNSRGSTPSGHLGSRGSTPNGPRGSHGTPTGPHSSRGATPTASRDRERERERERPRNRERERSPERRRAGEGGGGSRSSRRERESEREAAEDWEGKWRRDGNGGGNVAGWRLPEDDAPSDRRGGGGGSGGAKGGKGQKYHGGY